MAYVAPSAGELRDVYRVERQKTVSDGLGGFTGAWQTLTDLSRVSARTHAERGGEEVRSDRLSGVSRFDVAVRSTPATLTIQSQDRLINLRTGAVLSVLWIGSPDDRGRWLHILCETGGLRDDSNR